MKRLKQNLPNTTPFINSDFHDILQDQHQLAYSAWLDSINDVSVGTSSGNDGIILKGCELVYVAPKINPNTSAVTFEYKLNFTDVDLIYLNGQYYTPVDELLNREISITDSRGFYLKGVTFSDEQTEINAGRVREFRDKTVNQFSVDYRFDLVSLGANGKFPTASEGIHYVAFEWGGTSRRLKRLLKYNRAAANDVMMHANPKGWTVSAEDSPYQKFGNFLFRDFDLDGIGRNEMQGFRMFHELGGKFMVGFSSSSPTTPVSADPLSYNYGKAGNYGGTNSLTFSISQIPAHDHGGVLQISDPASLDHAHVINARHPYSQYPANYGYIGAPLHLWNGGVYPTTGGYNAYYTSPENYFKDYGIIITTLNSWVGVAANPSNNLVVNGQYRPHRALFAAADGPMQNGYQNVREQPIGEHVLDAANFTWWIKNMDTTDNTTYKPDRNAATWKEMSIHTHNITGYGNNIPRENRPPYFVVLYYTKI